MRKESKAHWLSGSDRLWTLLTTSFNPTSTNRVTLAITRSAAFAPLTMIRKSSA